MVTKLKKLSRTVMEKRKGRVWVAAGVWVAMVLFFMGFGIVTSSVRGTLFADLAEKEYVNSDLHKEDVENALKEVYGNLTSLDPVPADEWKFQGIYDFIISRDSYVLKHKTNISNEAYEEYLSQKDTEEETVTEDGILELDGKGKKAKTDSEPDITKSSKLARWYFEQNLTCYYLWDGENFSVGKSVGQSVQMEVQSQFEALGKERQIGIGFTEDMLKAGQERLDEARRNIMVGGSLCVLAVVMMIVGGVLFILGNQRQERIPTKSYSDVAGMICIAAGFGMAAGFPWTRVVFPNALWMGTMLFIACCSIYIIVRNIAAHIRLKEHFFSLCLIQEIAERITGKAYYEEGIIECDRKRQRLTFCILLGILGAAIVPLYAVRLFYDIDVLDLPVVIWQLFCILLAGVVVAVYGYGSRKISREYNKLLVQIEELFEGNYQNNGLLSEGSVFFRESLKMSMLGCQIRENIEKQIQAEKMKMDLVTNVSHDLKTPLTSIISYIDLLSKEELGPAAEDYVRVLEQKSERLKKMIADVFDLTKATSGNLQVCKERIDIHKLLIQILADSEQQIGKTSVKIVQEFADEPVMIESDGEKLYRVFQNILDNALKYAMPETRVYIALTRKQGEVVLRIKNVSGYEMNFTKEEVLGRFFRGDKARSTEGSGLGLAIAKEFTEVCGGTFDLNIDGDVFQVEIRFRSIS